MPKLELVPMTLREANALVAKLHRHSKPVRGCKFAIGVAVDEKVVGVAIVGRPVARLLDNGWTAEVLRVCTDGTRNTCSILYGACWRAARAMGYKRLITYTRSTEGGASLRASNFVCVGECGGGHWSRKDRPRVTLGADQLKLRWEIEA